MTNAALGNVLASKQVVFIGGSGGVGKTTVSAALAVSLAIHTELSVLVITVDPARRLADALGVSSLGNEPVDVDLGSIKAKGRLSAAMVDMKDSWDQIVQRCADPAVQERIFANPIYQNISSQFVQSHDYIAVEVLFELSNRGNFDLIVVDTPPSRNAIDFLDAPARMEEFFSSKLLKWLIAPYRSKVFVSAFKPFNAVAERILGSDFVAQLAEFFVDFQGMQDGFLIRAKAVSELIKSEKSAFVVVTTPSEAPVTEANFLISELVERNLPLSAVIVNRTLPKKLADREVVNAAARLEESAQEATELLVSCFRREHPDVEEELNLALPAIFSRVLSEVENCYRGLSGQLSTEVAQRTRIGADRDSIIEIPQMRNDIASLQQLSGLLEHLWG